MGTFKFPIKRDRDGNLTHKTCRGKLHFPGKLLPVGKFRGRGGTRGGMAAWCLDCESYYASQIKSKSPQWKRQIKYQDVKFIFDELVNRLGIEEMLRRTGVSQQVYWMLRKNRSKYIGRPWVEKAMNVLKECRENNEVRHRDSIHRGATMRGEKEKIPENKSDLYKPHGDSDTEHRKAYRRKYENKDRAA